MLHHCRIRKKRLQEAAMEPSKHSHLFGQATCVKCFTMCYEVVGNYCMS
jgi:hypothetical protein